ncbi:universal stress protein [Streptomyces sp. MJP52]|uniref:universal stress protein n=1 Tax=Streptomyces sp. MJP52 TaxID=2940555 RepID=UPI0024748912|nr:universal stress protein [Streptomyces sp. MJP52]MDH6223997.1 nucleotide-binding universal stress UspA family protein [Streptomyces sp. MJP52]
MNGTAERPEIVVGVDPAGNWRLAVSWAVDEAERRRSALRLVVAVPPPRDSQHVDDTPRFQTRAIAGRNALAAAAGRVHERGPGIQVTTALLEGEPARVMAGLSQEAAMVVLGSRHLSRTEEFLSAGSLVVPVTAQARCPVVVVGDAEHGTQAAPYLVAGFDGSESSRAALAFALEEAHLRGCGLRTVAAWEPPVFTRRPEHAALQAERQRLREATSAPAQRHPDVSLTHEVTVGPPVEVLAKAAEHALAVVVGRRGHGGYTGMRVGSVVHGLLHRAHCPVVTVPTA